MIALVCNVFDFCMEKVKEETALETEPVLLPATHAFAVKNNLLSDHRRFHVIFGKLAPLYGPNIHLFTPCSFIK